MTSILVTIGLMWLYGVLSRNAYVHVTTAKIEERALTASKIATDCPWHDKENAYWRGRSDGLQIAADILGEDK